MISVSDLLLQIQRTHILEAIKSIDAGAETRFADSTKFDLLFKKKRYAPKEVVGLALEALAKRNFGPRDFKGGEGSPCFRAISRCGFTIVRKRRTDSKLDLKEIVSEILALQTQYSSNNSEQMQRRGMLIREFLPDIIRDHLEEIEPIFATAGFSCAVEGSDGAGRKNESPWVRIHDTDFSPSATRGWYIVIHFSRDGRKMYATVGCGATSFVDGSLVNIPDAELTEQVIWAKSQVAQSKVAVEKYTEPVSLDGNKLSRQYEKAIAFAKSYEPAHFNEAEFWTDLNHLSKILVFLYEKERLGKSPLSESPEIVAARESVENIARPNPRSGRGQGRGLSHAERCAVERRAMVVAAEGLKSAGFDNLIDKSSSSSYDYLATKEGKEWKVEVKGTTSSVANSFLITAAELKLHSKEKGQTVLAIVSNIDLIRDAEAEPKADGGVLELCIPWDPDEWEFEPTAFQARRF